MRLHFEELKLKNFMSFEEAILQFDQFGFILVQGENKSLQDNALSNGSGKSSLFNAICWCLTGQTPNGVKNINNIYRDGEASVELSFKADKDYFTIKRSREPSNLKITINGVDKSGKGIRDSEKLLTEYLPSLTESLINSVIILGQGLPQRFTNNTPAGRKAVLEELFNSDFMIEDLKTRVKTRKEALDKSKRDKEDLKLKSNVTIEQATKYINETRMNLNSLEDSSTLQSKVTKMKSYLTMIGRDYDKFKNYLTKEETTYKNLLDEKANSYNQLNNRLEELPKKNTEDLNSQLITLQANRNQLASEIKQLKSIRDACPTCHQKLIGVHKVDTTERELKLKSLDETITSLDNSLKKAQDYNKSLEVTLRESFSSKLDQLEELINKSSTRQDQLKANIQQVQDNTLKCKEAIHENETLLNSLEDKKKSYSKIISDQEELIKQNTEQVALIDKELVKLDDRLTIMSKLDSLLKRDFRGYLLMDIINFINKKCQAYAKEVFNTDQFTFTLDGNNINILLNQKEYESLSGGERSRCDIIIQLAIRDLLCSFTNFSSNILVIDEVTDFLDYKSADAVYNLISSKLTDVDVIYIIAHRKDFSVPIDGFIKVIKDENNISRIEG